MPQPPTHAGVAIILAPVGCALALGGCGSAGAPATTGTSNGYTSFLEFSECMRAPGVPHFPDPVSGSGGFKLDAGSAVNPQSPASQSAQQSPTKLLPGGGATKPAVAVADA